MGALQALPGGYGTGIGLGLANSSTEMMQELVRDDTCGNRKALEKVLAAIKR